jgi:N utilization substance protein B
MTTNTEIPAGPHPPDAADAAAAPAPQRKPGGARRSGPSPRRRSREFALQGLYEWLLARGDAGVIDAHMREQEEFERCDSAHFDALLHGCIRDAATLDAALARHVDRKTSALSPVEHAALMIGVWELANCIEIPYKVVINEAVELAKAFGGTDGHKYVNGVLDRTAADLRAVEVAQARSAPRRS